MQTFTALITFQYIQNFPAAQYPIEGLQEEQPTCPAWVFFVYPLKKEDLETQDPLLLEQLSNTEGKEEIEEKIREHQLRLHRKGLTLALMSDESGEGAKEMIQMGAVNKNAIIRVHFSDTKHFTSSAVFIIPENFMKVTNDDVTRLISLLRPAYHLIEKPTLQFPVKGVFEGVFEGENFNEIAVHLNAAINANGIWLRGGKSFRPLATCYSRLYLPQLAPELGHATPLPPSPLPATSTPLPLTVPAISVSHAEADRNPTPTVVTTTTTMTTQAFAEDDHDTPDKRRPSSLNRKRLSGDVLDLELDAADDEEAKEVDPAQEKVEEPPLKRARAEDPLAGVEKEFDQAVKASTPKQSRLPLHKSRLAEDQPMTPEKLQEQKDVAVYEQVANMTPRSRRKAAGIPEVQGMIARTETQVAKLQNSPLVVRVSTHPATALHSPRKAKPAKPEGDSPRWK